MPLEDTNGASGVVAPAAQGTLLDFDAVVTSIEWHENIHLRFILELSGRLTADSPDQPAMPASHYEEFFSEASNALEEGASP